MELEGRQCRVDPRRREDRADPIGRRAKVELRALRDEVEPGNLYARTELGTRSPKADQG